MNLPGIDETHSPDRRSWVAEADGHLEFPIQNLPFGIFSPAGGAPRPGIAIGDRILDLAAVSGLLPPAVAPALQERALNRLFALPAADRRQLRRRVSLLLSEEENRDAVEPALHPAADCALHLPAVIGDYTDFYVGIHHAANVGSLLRPNAPLLPNYKYVPIGYHGRASSIRPSGVAVARPCGQRKAPHETEPRFGPSKRLDYELELGIWIGPGNALGTPVPIAEARAHVAGFSLLNDWSARDLQAWEYQPLGPFLAKSFHTTVSPWVVTSEALAPFRIAQPPRAPGDPKPLPYLWDKTDQACGALSIELEAFLLTGAMQEAGLARYRLSRGPASHMYWTVAQIVAHHASNGCNLNSGDLLGTGTISAPDRDGYGSLLEITRGGTDPVALPSGETRCFLEDGDEILLTAHARADGYVPIGFGACRASILPASASR
jgi:fumarylacetoacetase